MGADVHVVLGRINVARIAMRPPLESTSTAVALFGNANVDAEDFELENVPEEYDLTRNYALFGWLSGVRGCLRPFHSNIDDRRELVRRFLDWLDTKKLENARKNNPDTRGFGYYDEDYIESLDSGDHSRNIFTMTELLAFNYDEVCIIEDGCDRDMHSSDTIYFRDPEGTTYREAFGEAWFKLMKYCAENNWQFILFGFDN